MAGLLVDTNHLSAALDPVSRLRERFYECIRAGVRIGTCFPVICELEAGIQQLSNPPRHRQQLDYLLEHLRLWPVDRKMAIAYGEAFVELSRRGRILSHVDVILVAFARQMNLTLLTADRDFEGVLDLKIENWIA